MTTSSVANENCAHLRLGVSIESSLARGLDMPSASRAGRRRARARLLASPAKTVSGRMATMRRPSFQFRSSGLFVIGLAANVGMLRLLWGTPVALLFAAVSGTFAIIGGVVMAEKANQTTWPALLQVLFGLFLIALAMVGDGLGAFGV
jgi:hypothetical protein